MVLAEFKTMLPNASDTGPFAHQSGTGEITASAAAAAEREVEPTARFEKGHSERLAMLLEQYRAPVVNFLYRMLQNQARAEDLAQGVFLRVHRSRSSIDCTKLLPRLFHAATSLALIARGEDSDGFRPRGFGKAIEEGPRRAAAGGLSPPEQALPRAGSLREVLQAMAALPGKQRAAFLMYKYEGMLDADIALALDCPEKAVTVLLYQAYEALGARIGIETTTYLEKR